MKTQETKQVGREPSSVTCPHCKGTGSVLVPAEVETVEAYYFGCWDRMGHFWRSPRDPHDYTIDRRVPKRLAQRIDGGWCPGAVAGDAYRRTRPEIEGEAALHHVEGWTVLAFWDRSVDKRGACNSNFVARGTFDFASMIKIAQRQFPSVWGRFAFEVRLVHTEQAA